MTAGIRWRWAAASEIGTSHFKLGTRKQDALRCFMTGRKEAPVFSGIICDGAGSAEFGGEGASVVCRILSLEIREHFSAKQEMPQDEKIWSWIDSARDTLALAADRRSKRRQAFASTLIALVAAPDSVLAVHVGDGAIVGRQRSGAWIPLSWPDSGEYASTTYFVTEDPMPKVRISRFASEFDAFALFSDGIESLALDNKLLMPHEPFFRSMINPLDSSDTAGKVVSLSSALAGFLKSEKVCQRTDDDKSLILASAK